MKVVGQLFRMRFKSDLRTFVQYLLINLFLRSSRSLSCDKTFTYYEEYGQNSFNVSCTGIIPGYEHILENITIFNEISLTVTDSVLENINPDIFSRVSNIKILNISNCTFDFDKNLAIFKKLEKLETLIIRDTHFQIENVTLGGLENLKRLELRNNSFSVIEKGAFQELSNLEKLEILDNHVKQMEDLQLCEFKKLKYLSVKRNLVSNLKSFYFFCLKNTKSLDFSINDHPALPNIYQASYFNITSTTYDLIELDLSFNQIVDLGYSLEELRKLRILNLGHNKLISLKESHVKWLFRLQKLILTNNEIRTVDGRTFINKTQLTLVDLSHNLLSSFTISDLPQLKYLDLSYNNLSSISLKNLKSLSKVNLAFNNLSKLKNNAFQKVPYLDSLNLSGNHLDLSLGLFKSIAGLRYLSLSNNSLTTVPEKVFLGLKNLRLLDLSFNNLHNLTVNTFHDLESLEMLNLSFNSIESLSYKIVEPLKNLRSLDVAANKLAYIEYDIILSKLQVLSNINIKLNLLTCENLGRIIEFLKQKHIVYTNSENLDADNLNQNVAGIPCRSGTPTSNKLLIAVESKPESNSFLLNFGIIIVVVLVSVLTGIITYRFYIYLKRRRYRADEFELVVD